MKRALKWIAGIVLTPIILFVVLTALLYVPSIQDWAVNYAARKATEETGFNVKVEHVGITFLFDVDMRGVCVTDEVGDTLLDVKRLVLDLDLKSLTLQHIAVKNLTLYNGTADTKQLIDGMTVSGSIKRFSIAAPQGIDLEHHTVQIRNIEAKGCKLSLHIADSEPDTTQTEPLPWTVQVARVDFDGTDLTLATDSLWSHTHIERGEATSIECDLQQQSYKAEDVLLQATSSVWMPSLHPDTLTLSDIDLRVAEAVYNTQETTLKDCQLQIRNSGLSATLRAVFNPLYDSSDPESGLPLDMAEIDLSSHFDRSDVLWASSIAGIDTTTLAAVLPQEPLTIDILATGSPKQLYITSATITLPELVSLHLGGTATDLLDPERLSASIGYDIHTCEVNHIGRRFGMSSDLRLPEMSLMGTLESGNGLYEAKNVLEVDRRQVMVLTADYNCRTQDYKAATNIFGLNLRRFMPSCPVSRVKSTLKFVGHGLDYMSRSTNFSSIFELQECRMDSVNINDLCVTATYLHRRAAVLVDFSSPQLMANLGINAKVEKRDSVSTDFTLDLSRIDLHALGMAERPVALGGTVHFDGHTNLSDRHQLSGGMHDLIITTPDTMFHPKNIDLDLLVYPDTLAATAQAGDLQLSFAAGQGIEPLLKRVEVFTRTIEQQVADYNLNQEELRPLLPTMTARVRMGSQNPVANIARFMGCTWHNFDFVLDARPELGLNGGGHVSALGVGAMKLDTVAWSIYQDTTGVKLDARVCNGHDNPQICFDARANAYVLPTGAGLNLKYYDERGRCGMNLGAQIDNLPDGIRMHLTPLRPIVAYRHFEVNPGNFIKMTPEGRVEADLDLLADDGTRFSLYSTPDTSATTLQDLTVSLHHLNVDELCSVLPYMPKMGGLLYGDTHLVQTTDNLSVALDSRIDGFTYEGADVGDIGLNATYLPMGDSCHYVNALLSHDDEEIILLDGTYTDNGADGQIEAVAQITHLPLKMISGIVADPKTMSMGGDIDGELAVTGSVDSPQLEGYLVADSMNITMPSYNLTLTAVRDTLPLRNSRLTLDGLDFYSKGRRPLTVSGWVDMSDLSKIRLDTRLNASRFELINAKRTPTAEAYGRMLVDINAQLQGTLEDISLRGRLGILSGTDLTYVLMDSPLTVEDRLSDLVTFEDFSDTLALRRQEEATEAQMNMSMNMQVNIEESAQLHCLLSADRSSYVDLEGGGSLMLSCTPRSDLMLTGRYTIQRGEMKYALPVIPLKTFELKNGSYVEWNGKMLNPTLNITATERMRSAVGGVNGQTRTVPFDVGLDITQTLENMGLAFTIDSPEDAAVQNELAQMDAAARGRVAVTMLATGMYITDNGLAAGGFSTTNALNTFLQSEISSLTGKALKTVDVSVGVEEGTSAAGTSTTDYSFSFAKRFWNNRFSVSFGGKVSSGADAQNTGATIIDNVALEYRLDNSATRYVRLSYDKNYESLLEGTITEMGAGLVLRRKTARLGELFIFRKKKK